MTRAGVPRMRAKRAIRPVVPGALLVLLLALAPGIRSAEARTDLALPSRAGISEAVSSARVDPTDSSARVPRTLLEASLATPVLPVAGVADRTPGRPHWTRTTFAERTPSAPLAEPSGVVSDAFGRVWMSDAALHKLVRFESDGRRLDETGALGTEPGQFRRPGALARVGSLGVAVLDIENRRVTVYDHHLRSLGAAIELSAAVLEARIGRVTPVGLASDRGGALYVADAERDRILVFDFAGEYQREIGGFGGRAGGFSGLLAVAVDARGTLVTVERPRGRAKRAVVDSLTGRSRLQWLDAGGRVLHSVWLPAWSAGAAESGLALAVSAAGWVAVAAERSGVVLVLDADGRELVRASGIGAPRALAFDDAGDLIVAAAGEAHLLRFTFLPSAAE